MQLFLDIHTHHPVADDGVRQIYNAGLDPDVAASGEWLSVGIHPWFLTDGNREEQFRLLSQNAAKGDVKLIGECGVDRLRGPSLAVQRTAFEQQIQLAEAVGKPVLIHCVRAFDEVMALGKRYAHRVPLIIHGYNKSPQLAAQLIKCGFYLSFGAAIRNEASSAAKTLSELSGPFFLETDDTQLDIRTLYAHAAFLRKVSGEELKDVIFAAWKTIQVI